MLYCVGDEKLVYCVGDGKNIVQEIKEYCCNARMRRTSVFTKLLGALWFRQSLKYLFNNYYVEYDICKPLCSIYM